MAASPHRSAGDVAFVPLSAIDPARFIDLMNNRAVGRYLPLLTGRFSEEDCRGFLAAKQAMWDHHGYGPRAFLIKGRFAGWGGLQPEDGEADFALVLHPDYWGWGRVLFETVKAEAFGPMGLDSITALLPPGRTNARAITRLGFIADGMVEVGGEAFQRYRLNRPQGRQRA